MTMYWHHVPLLICSILGLYAYPLLFTWTAGSPLLLIGMASACMLMRPHLLGKLVDYVPAIDVSIRDSRPETDIPRVTLLHSGSDCLNPMLSHLTSYVQTDAMSVLLIPQWLYYLNPVYVIVLEMLTGVKVSYLQDFNVRELLSTGHRLIVTPGGAMENTYGSTNEQKVVLTDYRYWEMLRMDYNADVDFVALYGGLNHFWYKTTMVYKLRTWMAKRSIPTMNVFFPKFPSISDMKFHGRRIPFLTESGLVNDIQDFAKFDQQIIESLGLDIRIIRRRVPEKK